MRVLVVDDNPDQLELLRLALGRSFEMEACVSHSTFLKALSGMVPDVVLLDLHVGAHNARDFKQVLDEQGLQHIPVVLVSGSVDLHEQARALGCVAALQKPFALTELRSLLNGF